MAAATLQPVIHSIQTQLPSLGRDRFQIDQKIAETARKQFNWNLKKNQFYSTCSSVLGGYGVVNLIISIKEFISSHMRSTESIRWIGVSIMLNILWIYTRNREGYALQNALDKKNEDEVIYQLSLGADIHQPIWNGNAASSLFSPRHGQQPITAMEWFAECGYTKVVAYLAMLEPNFEKRVKQATKALPYAKDVKMAQLLIDLGGEIYQAKQLLSLCCRNKNLPLFSFFLQMGARLDAEISDYIRWQDDLDNADPASVKELPFNLHPSFRTPLESLLQLGDGPNRAASSTIAPSAAFEAMNINPLIYQTKTSPEELYRVLNESGVRIRREAANELFDRLWPRITT